ncbi:hypothetical protein AC477_01090, partial [miscellaneous Crenarchaeota group-1 archaeon SG8-32-1]
MEEVFERKLSYTSLATFRRCKMRYKWKYIDDYAPPSSINQAMGGVGHAGLGAWYTSLADELSTEEAKEAAFQAADLKLSEYERELGNELPDTWDNASLILDRYFDWSLGNDSFVAHEIEHKFELRIDDFVIIGYIDGIVELERDGSLWILEHKFTKQVRTKHLEIDPQISLYMLAARATGFDVRGAYYNVVRTTITGKAEKEPVVRMPVYR